MKNPHEMITIYKVWQGDSSKSHMITITMSESRIAYAFADYAEKAIAKAGGGGYDKRNTALRMAIEDLFLVKLDVSGGEGERAVAENAKAHGVAVEALTHSGRFVSCTD